MNKQQNQPLVSVIIPAYNVAEYLYEAINSIEKQEYSSLEIIIINDGSTDDTAVVCHEIERIYSNIVYLEQENQGPSVARNNGLKKAQGKYVTFVDADDSLPEGAITDLVKCAQDTEADVVVGCNDCQIISRKSQFIGVSEAINAALCGNLYLEEIEQALKSFVNMGAPWAKLIKRTVIEKNKITFPTNISHREDMIFCINVYAHSEKICILNRDVYHYNTMNENSLVRMYNKDKIMELLFILDEVNRVESYYKIPSIVKDNFAWNAIYEVWVKFFTHKNNEETIKESYLQINNFLHQKQMKEILNRYSNKEGYAMPKQERLVLFLMKYGMCTVLAWIAYFWRKIRNVNRL